MPTLPNLGYNYDALSPHISGTIMKLHHAGHHQAYVDKLNAALENAPEFAHMPVEDRLRAGDKVLRAPSCIAKHLSRGRTKDQNLPSERPLVAAPMVSA